MVQRSYSVDMCTGSILPKMPGPRKLKICPDKLRKILKVNVPFTSQNLDAGNYHRRIRGAFFCPSSAL